MAPFFSRNATTSRKAAPDVDGATEDDDDDNDDDDEDDEEETNAAAVKAVSPEVESTLSTPETKIRRKKEKKKRK